jgi:hypothetical protein
VGGSEVTGWITGFLHWNPDGSVRKKRGKSKGYHLSRVVYVPEVLEDIGVGYARVPLKLVNWPQPGDNTSAYVLAGNVGVLKSNVGKNVTVQPNSAWFLYNKTLEYDKDGKVKKWKYKKKGNKNKALWGGPDELRRLSSDHHRLRYIGNRMLKV